MIVSDLMGYSCTGASIGAFAGIKNIEVGEPTLAFDRVKAADDTKSCGKAYPIGYVQGPITLTLHWNKDLYDACEKACKAETKQAFTTTKTGVGTWTGDGYIQSPGSVRIGSDAKQEFTVAIEPETDWTFAKAT